MVKHAQDADGDTESECSDEEGTPPLGPVVCTAPTGGIALAAQKIGVTCQELFRLAYTEVGYTDQYSRAVFVQYLATNRALLPPIVLKYCMDVARSLMQSCGKREGTCFACRLDPKTFPGLVFSYHLIEPSVTRETLVGKEKRERPDTKTAMSRMVFEQNFLKFLEGENAFEDGEEDWRTMMDE